jgi:hypothetical protein
MPALEVREEEDADISEEDKLEIKMWECKIELGDEAVCNYCIVLRE